MFGRKINAIALGSNNLQISGSFGMSATKSGYYYDFILAAPGAIQIRHARNGTLFTAAATGSVYPAYTFATTHYDSSIEYQTIGVAGNSFKVSLVPGVAESVTFDVSTGLLTITFEDGVSTRASIDALFPLTVGAHTFDIAAAGAAVGALAIADDTVSEASFTGGTEETSASISGGTITLSYTDATTTCTDAIAALNALNGVTASTLSGVAVIGVADAVASQALIAAEAFRGNDYSVSKVATGTYRIVLDEPVSSIVSITGSIQTATASAAAHHLQFSGYTSASRHIDARILVGATPTDIAVDANNRINFALMAVRK